MNGMDRAHLSDLDGRHSNVAVIGAGINGVGATQQLATAGYSTLLVYNGRLHLGNQRRVEPNLSIAACAISRPAAPWATGCAILHALPRFPLLIPSGAETPVFWGTLRGVVLSLSGFVLLCA